MEESTNVGILKEAFEKWNDSEGTSIDHWLGIMADDVCFQSLGNGEPGMEFTCPRSSKAAVEEYLHGLTAQLTMIHYTVKEYIAKGDRVIAIGTTAWVNKATGREFETPKVDVVRFRDGKIVDFLEMYDTAKVLDVSKPDVKGIIEKAYETRRREDVDEALDYFHPNATFRIVANSSLGEISQSFTGHDALRAAFEQFFKTWDWRDFPIKDIIVDGNKAAVHSCGTMHHAPSRTDFTYEILDIVTLEDGKIVDFVEFLDTHMLKQLIDKEVS